MEEVDEKIKELIEELYFEIKAYAEGEYYIEGNVNINKKYSDKIVFRDRKKAITIIKDTIEKFSEKYSVDKNLVKNCLLEIIEQELNSEKKFKGQEIEMKKIVEMDNNEER